MESRALDFHFRLNWKLHCLLSEMLLHCSEKGKWKFMAFHEQFAVELQIIRKHREKSGCELLGCNLRAWLNSIHSEKPHLDFCCRRERYFDFDPKMGLKLKLKGLERDFERTTTQIINRVGVSETKTNSLLPSTHARKLMLINLTIHLEGFASLSNEFTRQGIATK